KVERPLGVLEPALDLGAGAAGELLADQRPVGPAADDERGDPPVGGAVPVDGALAVGPLAWHGWDARRGQHRGQRPVSTGSRLMTPEGCARTGSCADVGTSWLRSSQAP